MVLQQGEAAMVRATRVLGPAPGSDADVRWAVLPVLLVLPVLQRPIRGRERVEASLAGCPLPARPLRMFAWWPTSARPCAEPADTFSSIKMQVRDVLHLYILHSHDAEHTLKHTAPTVSTSARGGGAPVLEMRTRRLRLLRQIQFWVRVCKVKLSVKGGCKRTRKGRGQTRGRRVHLSQLGLEGLQRAAVLCRLRRPADMGACRQSEQAAVDFSHVHRLLRIDNAQTRLRISEPHLLCGTASSLQVCCGVTSGAASEAGVGATGLVAVVVSSCESAPLAAGSRCSH